MNATTLAIAAIDSVATREQYAARRTLMDAKRRAFLREWQAEFGHLPESKSKAIKMLRDWQAYIEIPQ